ncbi:CBS domain-containing protein [Flagellimonas zhangzhouensis]|uniref:CBS domain-containing protein n=1 Tax=Flagellimonas zhangzhouensis TaxID=1073328 RepID=A0A1H2X4R5_9FLAO|nr:CBS domain-containing protein [Allomuricauda zhangzhouensis]SDQ27970.1 CBS domain-containing protein [Allomuricauda zhangzhouensis]SDW87778.1 CBS domain-containing protein [Allomuricauda zhangzhouensis]
MYIHDRIIHTVPVFEVSETLKDVIAFFEETTSSHVAVTENGTYLGLLSENDLACFEPEKTIEDFRYELEHFFVTKETSWLDVLEMFSRNEANVLPILDKDQMVQGYYSLDDIVDVFIDTPFFKEPGAILVVSIGAKDYSFSEMAQIVESNNARLLGAFITNAENDMVQITLKIGTQNMNEVAQTFRRYNYTIEFGNSDDQFLEDLKQRSDYLEKYLNV